MKQETVTIKEASSEITSSAESEKVAVVDSNYTGYFYRNINQLWDEIVKLQQDNTQLKAQVKGEY